MPFGQVRTFSLGYSPCPNDTFIFYALVHGKIPGDLAFSETLHDVETLNRMAFGAELDVTKISFHAFGHLRDRYCLLRSGGALGRGCGPLVIARDQVGMDELRGKVIAIPGRLTTAFLLLQIFDPSLKENVRPMPFDQIAGAVADGSVDAGLIIHESRFTYGRAGLKKVLDLGEWWEKETGLLLPLGGILAKREFGAGLIGGIDRAIRRSVEYAFRNKEEPLGYIKRHSQELEDKVINSHIRLYVNDFSLDIGGEGRAAVEELFRRSESSGILPRSSAPLFAG